MLILENNDDMFTKNGEPIISRKELDYNCESFGKND